MDLLKIFAGKAANGEAVREELPVRKIDESTYELLASPGLALHVAKGDTVRWLSPEMPLEIIH